MALCNAVGAHIRFAETFFEVKEPFLSDNDGCLKNETRDFLPNSKPLFLA